MYANGAAVPRPEISVFLEEAQDVEKKLFAEKVMPVYTSDEPNGRYPRLRIDLGNLLNRESTKRAKTGEYNEVDRTHEWDVFNCVDRGLEEMVDDALARQYKRFFDAEVYASKLVRRAMMLDYEVRTADLIMNPNTFNSTDGHYAYTEAELDNFDFAKDVEEAALRGEEQGVEFNTLILSKKLLFLIRRSKKFQNYIFGRNDNGNKKTIRVEDIKDYFGLEQVLISTQTFNAAEDGQPKDLQPCWGNDYMALLNVQSGDFENGGVGRTIVWGADCPGGLFISESYREEKRRGDMVRVRTNSVEKIISEIDGELIHTGYTPS